MNLIEKLDCLQNNHMGEWLKTRRIVTDEMSSLCSVFCFCGKLCTGLHESHCRKFNDRVTKETVNRLSHLLKESK